MTPRRAILAALALAAGTAALADDHGRRSAPMPNVYVQECGSCHAPFPSRLLPAASWQRQMDGLARHYGSDASLEPAAKNAITTWLVANAATGRRAATTPPEDRITKSEWFQREHREVGAATWSRPQIRSAANCGACHVGAAQGRYDEDDVRIPR